MPETAQRRFPRRRVLAEWAMVAVVSTVLVAVLATGRLTQRVDNLVYDTLSKLATRPSVEDIVVVAIDNRSIAELGRWPWPRAQHEAMLRRLAQAGPKAVAYDVLFVDPDPDPRADVALAEAVKAAAPVYLPLTFDVPGEDGAPFRTMPPVAPLARAAAGVGQVNLEFDPDGVVRRAFLAEVEGDRVWPHLMELVYRDVHGQPSPAYGRGQEAPAPALPGLVRERPVLIAFAGPPGHFRTISFSDLLRGDTPPEFLKGKLVLVGATADGLGDRYATPLSGGNQVMPGVELQANLLDALLSETRITPLGPWGRALFALAPLWLLLAGFLWLRPRANMLLGLGLLVATLGASAVLMLLAGVWAPPIAAVAGLLLVYPFWSWRRLEAISAYMVDELRQFADEPDLLPALSDPAGRSDVTGRQVDLMRSAIERARDLRGFVTNALQGLPDATLVAGLDGRVLIANREAEVLFESLTGAPAAGAIVGDLTSVLTTIAQPDSDDDAPAADVEMESPRGQVFNVRHTGLQNARGETAGWIVRFSDISALKAAGRQREHILQLLTHDMRSPQVSILALLEGASDQAIEPALSQRVEGYARRTLSLADNFVQLARAEARPYVMEPVDLGEVLLDAVDDLWPQSSTKGIVVSTETVEGETLVLGDRSLLTRVLINLIGNAIKYTEAGGRVDCRIATSATPTGSVVICTVADTGRGMSAGHLAHLFEPFRRDPGAGHIDGVGLGLAFVQAVVQRHGGQVSCESSPGEGATFTVTLPGAAS